MASAKDAPSPMMILTGPLYIVQGVLKFLWSALKLAFVIPIAMIASIPQAFLNSKKPVDQVFPTWPDTMITWAAKGMGESYNDIGKGFKYFFTGLFAGAIAVGALIAKPFKSKETKEAEEKAQSEEKLVPPKRVQQPVKPLAKAQQPAKPWVEKSAADPAPTKTLSK